MERKGIAKFVILAIMALTGLSLSVPDNLNYSGAGRYAQGQTSHSPDDLTTVRGYSLARDSGLRNEIDDGSLFVYDGNGNPVTYDGATVNWDEENRMTSFGNGGKTYVYRADGLRAWKAGGGSQTNYIYDIFGNPVLETSGSTVTATNTFGANGLVSRNSGIASTFYNFDAFGNTSQQLDSSGNVLSTHACDEYGLVTSTSVPNDPYYGFGAQFGYYHDSETNLYLLGHRYYEPSYASFVNQHPIGMNGGANLFQYVGSNPLLRKDRSGFGFCSLTTPQGVATLALIAADLGLVDEETGDPIGHTVEPLVESACEKIADSVEGAIEKGQEESGTIGDNLWRVVEKPEEAALGRTNGVPTPSPFS